MVPRQETADLVGAQEMDHQESGVLAGREPGWYFLVRAKKRSPPARSGARGSRRSGLPASPQGRIRLERRHLHHRKQDSGWRRRASSHLDRAEGERAVLPAGFHLLLARKASLVAPPSRIPPRQRPPTR